MPSKKKAEAQPRRRSRPGKGEPKTAGRERVPARGRITLRPERIQLTAGAGHQRAAIDSRQGASLRPERIQSASRGSEPGGRSAPAWRRLSEAEVETAMADLLGWRLAADRRSIGCALRFPAYPLAVVFLNLVTSLAEFSAYYPEIAVRGPRVSLRLASPEGRGLTAEVFSFAHALDGAAELGRAALGSAAGDREARP